MSSLSRSSAAYSLLRGFKVSFIVFRRAALEDPHHRGDTRELRSPAEMRKLLNRKIVEQDRKCAMCHEEFTDYTYVRAGSQESQRNGQRFPKRSSGECPSNALLVQR